MPREAESVKWNIEKRLSGDFVFKGLTVLFAFSILAILLLMVVEMTRESLPTMGTFGWRFITGRDWDAVQGSFGALPYIWGSVVSSLLALLLATPLSVGAALFITEMAPKKLGGISRRPHRTPRRHSERHLRPVGGARHGPLAAEDRRAVPERASRFHSLLPGGPVRSEHARRRVHPDDHGHPDHHLHHQGSAPDRSPKPERGGHCPGGDPLGDDPAWRCFPTANRGFSAR